MIDKLQHDVSNVINILLGNAEILLEEDLDPEAREIAQEVFDAATRLTAMLDQLWEGRA
jgi:signal transduction histidine kinase